MTTTDHMTKLLVDVHQAVGRMEGRQAQFLEQFDQHVEEDRRAFAKIDELARLSSEGAGRRTVWTALVAAVIGLFSGYLGHKL